MLGMRVIWIIPVIAFSVLLLIPVGAQNGYAMMAEKVGDSILPREDLPITVYYKETDLGTAAFSPLVVVSDDPFLHLTGPGGFPDGVVFLVIEKADLPPGFVALCTGALLEQTRQHILTSAHCISDPVTGQQNLEDGTFARFEGDDGTVDIAVIEDRSFVHPDWLGEDDILCGNDIAILELDEEAHCQSHS